MPMVLILYTIHRGHNLSCIPFGKTVPAMFVLNYEDGVWCYRFVGSAYSPKWKAHIVGKFVRRFCINYP